MFESQTWVDFSKDVEKKKKKHQVDVPIPILSQNSH